MAHDVVYRVHDYVSRCGPHSAGPSWGGRTRRAERGRRHVSNDGGLRLLGGVVAGHGHGRIGSGAARSVAGGTSQPWGGSVSRAGRSNRHRRDRALADRPRAPVDCVLPATPARYGLIGGGGECGADLQVTNLAEASGRPVGIAGADVHRGQGERRRRAGGPATAGQRCPSCRRGGLGGTDSVLARAGSGARREAVAAAWLSVPPGRLIGTDSRPRPSPGPARRTRRRS